MEEWVGSPVTRVIGRWEISDVCVLGTEQEPSATAAGALNSRAISPAHIVCFKKQNTYV